MESLNNSLQCFNVRNNILLFCILIIIGFQGCTKDNIQESDSATEDYNADLLYSYYDQICQTIATTDGFFPPQASRAYGYIGIAQYESVVHGIPDGISLQNQLNGFSTFRLPEPIQDQNYHWGIASNAATAKMIKYMFDKKLNAANRKSIDSIEMHYHDLLSKDTDQSTAARSKAYGYSISDVVYNYSKTDGGHESYLDPFQLPYTIPSDPYCWVPTGAIKTPLSPKWGLNRPFLINNVTKTLPSPPVPYSEIVGSAFHKEAMTTYQQVKNNTPEQIEIAKYWADDPFATCTPSGHTFNILSQILKEERVTLAKASVAYARLAIAENDAFIVCWKGKYDYVLLRPVTYIQRFIDPTFKTLLGSPPFPAYTSGHSCEMGAGSRILTGLFTNGSGDYPFTDYSQLRYGFYARSFSNFNELAEECASSRLYGGIHYPMDNSKGLQVGRAVGDNVNREIKWPKNVK